MAPVTPNPDRIRTFEDQAAFETWLGKHHGSEPEIWIKIHKKASGLPTITYKEALDVALCWGWIDAISKSFDDLSFLQRFLPRGAKSIWSDINRQNVARLTAAGKMTPYGQAPVDAAKADGRWDNAYGGSATLVMPPALLAAITAEPEAYATYLTLNSQNRFALSFRVHNLKTEAGKTKRIAAFVAMLKDGKTIYPNGKANPAKVAAIPDASTP